MHVKFFCYLYCACTNEIRFYSVGKTILFQKTNEELDSVNIWREMPKTALAIASFSKFHSQNFNEFFSYITFILRLWKLSAIPSWIKVIQNISKKLTFMAHNSFIKYIKKFPYLKPLQILKIL
jgi:hypothetical protein